jgi:hypothetical protein
MLTELVTGPWRMTAGPGRPASAPQAPPGRSLPADTIMTVQHRAWGQIVPFRPAVVRRCARCPDPATAARGIPKHGTGRGAAAAAGAGSAEAAEVRTLAVSRIKTSRSTTTADGADATRRALIGLPCRGTCPACP